MVLWLASAISLRAAFVYEMPGEFLTSGDFNGDGIADVLVLDRLTGNARVGYSDGNGNLTWSAPLVTGVENATGCGVEHFLQTNKDCVALTAPGLNRVNLVDLSQTNSAGTPQAFIPVGVGPHAVAGLHAPRASISPGLPFLLIASSFNDASAELLDLGQWPGIGYGTFNESGPFDLANGLDLSSNLPTLGVGMVRGATNDELHLWEFDNVPGVVGAFSNLPPGSSYVFGTFNGEAFPRFIFYQSGGSNLAIVPLLQTNSGYTFGAELAVALNDAVQNVFFLSNGANGSAIIQFGDGLQGLSVPNGTAVLSSNYQAGAGAAGNVFTGVVPLGNGRLALLDAPPGAASAHAQILRFDGTNFTQLSTTSLPPISSRTSRANVWLFQLEPFVNRAPGFIASLSAPDWADGVIGLPGSVQVPTEADDGATNGLGNIATDNLGAAPSGAAFGIGNQYNPAISLFGYSAPRAADPVTVTISPPPGPYGSPLTISFTAAPSGSTVQYRAGSLDFWHAYAAPFSITNDAMVQFYGTSALGVRASLQFASYTFGNPSTSGTNSPILINPGDTNTVAVLSTNQLTISQDGTIFYGRVSAANNYTIWAINLDGSSDTYITTGARPRVSRDGRYLAFLRGGSPLVTQGNTYVRNLQTGQESLLYANTNYTIGYDWDLDGTTLIFDWNCWLWSINEASGSTATQLPLPSPDCYDDAPVVSPADGSLAFHNLNPSASIAGLYVTTGARTSKQRLNLGVPGASWPAWSPDGEWLAFVDGNSPSTAFSADSGTNLWLVRSSGTNLSQLSGFNDGTNRFPHGAIWAPDGSALVGAGTVFGTNGLWLIPLTPDYLECDGPPILLPTTAGDAIDFAGSIVLAPATSQIVSTQAPGLFIRQTPGAVVVYWNTLFAGYTLESETNVTAGAWTPVNGPYFLDSGYIEYWENRSVLAAAKYFRLHLTGAVVLSQPPALTIQAQANTVLLSWSTNIAGFILQSSTSLSPGTSWSDLPGPYATIGGSLQYTDPIAAVREKFYRLRGP